MSNSVLRIAIPVALAIAAAAAAYFTGGLSVVALGAALGMAAGMLIDSVLFKPNMVNTTNAPKFQFAASTEGPPVQIVFGTYRIAGNYINFDPSLVGSQAITQKQSGKGSVLGGGGKAQTVGYKYSAPFEYGLCMGPIDGVGEVYTSPNAKKVRDLNETSLGGGTISGVVGSNTITGAGTSFLSGLLQGAVLRLTDDITDSSSTAYTVFSVQDNGTLTTYEAIEEDFAGEAYTVRNAIVDITSFGGAEYLNLSFSGQEDEGGSVRLYRGSDTQTRVNSGDPWCNGDILNYRHHCWALFLNGYQVGQQPSAKTYQFEIQRFPKCLDADGNPIDGLYTRGSLDPTNMCYQDANPAAVLFEILTDPIWGLRRPVSELDIDSFKQASYSLAQQNIGMSFAIDSVANLSDVVDSVKQQCSVTMFMAGTQTVCRWLYDTKGDSYEIACVLNKSSLIDFKHSRPAWGTQVNDMRAQFINRLNAYSTSVAHEQDLANIDATKSVRSAQLNLTGLCNPDIAQRQVMRALRESSYPSATVSFTMNRWNSWLRQYNLFQLNWDDIGTEVVKAFYRIVSIEQKNDDVGGVTVTCMEDASYLPTTADDLGLTEPVFPYQAAPQFAASQTNLGSTGTPQVPSIDPVKGLELNCFATPLDPRAVFAFEKRATFVSGANISWSDYGASNFTQMATLAAFAVTGTTTAYPVTPAFDRAVGMVMTLNQPDLDLGTILGASLVQSAADSFEKLLVANAYYLVIDQEIMQVGYATDNGDGSVTLRNIRRGCFGTDITAHAPDALAWFTQSLDFNDYTVELTGMDSEANTGTAVEFDVVAATTGGAGLTSSRVFINPDESVRYLANRPFAPTQYGSPSVISGTPGATTFMVAFAMRPRAITFGAGVGNFLQESQYTGSPLDPSLPTTFRVQQFDAAGIQIGSGFDVLDNTTLTVTDIDGIQATKGLADVSGYVCQPNCKTIKVYSVVNGWACMTPLSIPLGI
jgi:hypothetical protein